MSTRIDHNDEDAIRALLIGRSITKVEAETLHLDNGTTLKIEGNWGCGGCSSGNYSLTELNETPINAIMNVEFECDWDEDEDDEYDAFQEADTTYRIFVLAEDRRIKLAEVSGTDGNGYYGTGYWIEVSS